MLDAEPDRRKRWESISRPLHEALVEATKDARRWRIVMLACHLAALLAIVNVPGGLPPLVALAITLSAPLSAWAAWGSGIGWLGAIHAALASSVEDRLEPDDADASDRRGRTRSRPIRPSRRRSSGRSTPSRRAPCSSSHYSWSSQRLLRDDRAASADRPVPAPGRRRPVGPHVRQLRDGPRPRPDLRPDVSARAPSSMPTTPRSSCPELLFDVFIAAGLAAPFVPIFMKLLTEETEEAEKFARTILTLPSGRWAIAAVVLFIVAPVTVDLIAPGFTSPEQRTLYTDLFRVMCITPLIFAASIVLGEILVAKRRFLFYGLAPLLYNGGIVLGTLLLHDQIGIFGAAVGAVVGALLHLAIRVIGILRTDVRLRPQLALRMPAVREFLRLMLPRMVGAPIEPLTFQFFTRVASGFVEGSLSAVSFARNFQSVPVSLIGVAFSLAAFPGLSSAAGRGDRPAFVQILRTERPDDRRSDDPRRDRAVRPEHVRDRAAPRRRRLRCRGRRPDGTVCSSAFALSVPFESLTYPLARAIYATRNTVLQVSASLAGPRHDDRRDAASSRPSFGMTAIPLAFALGSATKRRDPRASPCRSGSGGSRDLRRPGASARRGRRDRRDEDDELPVAVRVLALGALPRQEVALHLGPVLERAGRVGLAPDRRVPRVPRIEDVGPGHHGVGKDRRIGVGAVAGHHPGVGAPPGEEDRRRLRLVMAIAASRTASPRDL